MKAMQALRDSCEEMAALLARLGSVQKAQSNQRLVLSLHEADARAV